MRDSTQTQASASPTHVRAANPEETFNPAEIIESLPEDATPAQQDSAVQTRLPERAKVRSTRPDTLNLPGWHIPTGKISLSTLPSCQKDEGFFQHNAAYHPEIPARPFGKSAEPLPYLLRNDNWVTGILLCCFLVVLSILANNKKDIRKHLQDFFLNKTEKNQLFDTKTGQEMRHTVFLYLQTGLLAGLIYFDYTQSVRDLFMSPVSPHALLGIHIAICWLFLGLKQVVYAFVNWIFFDKERRKTWGESYSFLVSAEGILLFPLALVMVYFNLPAPQVLFYSILLLIFIKLLLFYKTFYIFFHSFHGFLHLIAYFCALEILPVLGLWQALEYTNDILL